ncbi:unnamed protein product [Spirodela intermedia]|uniref:Uncharacterized protein n=1 Tax=Spirodela intermedia TaxID=51605 RepID=A0A7I8LAP7_SPIIN|nr:unnamed protein product [Spirodela intermedia]
MSFILTTLLSISLQDGPPIMLLYHKPCAT